MGDDHRVINNRTRINALAARSVPQNSISILYIHRSLLQPPPTNHYLQILFPDMYLLGFWSAWWLNYERWIVSNRLVE
jgi:hypothetical protein